VTPGGYVDVCGVDALQDPGLSVLALDLLALDPCRGDEFFLVVFAGAPAASCGTRFVDIEPVFEELFDLLADLERCSLEGLGQLA
jgi:hypothetical protein